MAVVGDLVVGRQMKGRLPVSGSFSLPAFMASQADGFWYDFGTSAGLFQTTDESTPVTTAGQPIGRVNDRRTGPNSPRNATQATAGSRPAFQTTGAAFDGTADNLLTDYVAGVGANFIVVKVTVPGSLSATQAVAGSSDLRIAFLGVSSGGQARSGFGTSVVSAGPDLRGTEAVIGVSTDGATDRIFVNGVLANERASVFTPTATPLRVGCTNSFGTAANFWGGSIKRIVVGREFLTLERFNQIAAQL